MNTPPPVSSPLGDAVRTALEAAEKALRLAWNCGDFGDANQDDQNVGGEIEDALAAVNAALATPAKVEDQDKRAKIVARLREYTTRIMHAPATLTMQEAAAMLEADGRALAAKAAVPEVAGLIARIHEVADNAGNGPGTLGILLAAEAASALAATSARADEWATAAGEYSAQLHQWILQLSASEAKVAALTEALKQITATCDEHGHWHGHWHGVAGKLARAAVFDFTPDLSEKDWARINSNLPPANVFVSTKEAALRISQPSPEKDT